MLEIISVYLGIFILGIGEIIFAKTVLDKNIQVSKFKFCLVFIFITLIYSFCYLYLESLVKSLFLYLIHMIEFKFLFNISFSKSIFLTFLYAIVLMLVEIVVLLMISNLGMSVMFIYNEFAGSIFSNILICIFFIIFTFLLKYPLKKLLNTEVSYSVKILLLSILTFFCLVMFFYMIVKTYEFSNDIFLYLIAIFVLISILFSLIKQTIENNKLMKEYDKLLEFMTTYENEIEKQRILRHETKNEFLTIKAKLCDKQKNREIVAYIDEILKDKIIVNQEKYAKFGYLPANGIKGLCYFKVQEAENLGIDVSINVSSKMKKSSIYNLNIKNQRDFGKILGVFLDNAIEASLVSKKKQLGIEIYVNNKKETVVIISNTFNNDINKTIIGKERFTTKGKNRGHGLLLVKHILEKNNIFEVKNDIVNEIYIQTIIIKSK